MNYRAIYERFIASRRAAATSGVTQRHHVVPRSLGGTDEPENIVCLEPGDHLFAHLLLAKIHGGTAWRPVFMMVGPGKRVGKRRRTDYAWAVRAAAAHGYGRHSWQYDHAVYEFEHKDGGTFRGERAEFIREFNLQPSAVCTLLSGRAKHCRGWYLKGSRPQTFSVAEALAGERHHQAKSEVLELAHKSGRRFVGTRLEAHRQIAIRRPSLSKLTSGEQRTAEGWRLVAIHAPQRSSSSLSDIASSLKASASDSR